MVNEEKVQVAKPNSTAIDLLSIADKFKADEISFFNLIAEGNRQKSFYAKIISLEENSAIVEMLTPNKTTKTVKISTKWSSLKTQFQRLDVSDNDMIRIVYTGKKTNYDSHNEYEGFVVHKWIGSIDKWLSSKEYDNFATSGMSEPEQ